jgi:hypothetical protein
MTVPNGRSQSSRSTRKAIQFHFEKHMAKTKNAVRNHPATRIGTITDDERRSARQAYEHHRAVCKRYDLEPADFATYMAEWVEDHRGPAFEPAPQVQGPTRNYSDRYSSGDMGGIWK